MYTGSGWARWYWNPRIAKRAGPPGEVEKSIPSHHTCFHRGGGFYGMFSDRTADQRK